MSNNAKLAARSNSVNNGHTVSDASYQCQAHGETGPLHENYVQTLSGNYAGSLSGNYAGSLSGNFSSLLPTVHGKDPELVHPNTKYECCVCVLNKKEHRFLRDPIQTTCGHRMCLTCVEDYLGEEESKICPANEEDCDQVTRSNIIPDHGCRREIKQLQVYCPNRSSGCEEKIKFFMLEKHLAECHFRLVECVYLSRGCTESVPFHKLKKHKSECEYQPLICEQCGMEFNLNCKKLHDAEICPEAIVNCPYSCGMLNLKRKHVEDHEAVCPSKPEECQFKILGCTFTGSKENVEKHQQDTGSHFQVLLECFTNFKIQTQKQQQEMEDLKQKIMESSRNLEKTQHIVKNLNKEMKLKMVQQVERLIIVEQKLEEYTQTETRFSQELEHLKQSVEQLKTLIPQVANQDRQIASHQLRMAEMDVRFQMIETASYNGALLWKICDFSKRRKDAIEGRTVSLYSQPFYTSQFGYKMCGRVYLNGDGIGRGTHMSLYFVVMRGEYDALLSWPFTCKVSLMLLDQSPQKKHLKDEFLPDPASSSFRRPMHAEMNVASGCPLFVAHTVLNNQSNNYVKDNTIFIKIMVDTTNIPPI